ncbi:MAG: tail fiber domain-containing protein [Chlorobi bacterium]|nr:tail fiber domain-containing protein [Chlorobiota bacterium]
MKNVVYLIAALWPLTAISQISINSDGSDPHEAAMLEVVSDSKGVLIPRITADARDAIGNVPQGLTVFVTDDSQFYYYDGTQWLPFGKNDADWKVEGNDMYAVPAGNVGIGTAAPGAKLEVAGAGAVNGTSSADNTGFILEETADADTGLKLFAGPSAIQTAADGDASDLAVNPYGGGLEINQGKFYFDGDADTDEGVLYGGTGYNRKSMLIYRSDPGEPDGNMVVLSASGLTVISGGGDGHRALDRYVAASDLTYNNESVYILADENDPDEVAINMSVALQHDAEWEDRKEAVNIYGNGMVQIIHNHDAGTDSSNPLTSDLIIGDPEGKFLALDDNEIIAMDGDQPTKLMLNYNGGRITMFQSDNPGTLNINGGGDSYALNLPDNGTNNIGKARANAWVTYSDRRIKSDFREIERPLQILDALRPWAYYQHNSRFVSEGKGEKVRLQISESGFRRYGFVAQELYKVLPEAVHKPADESSDLWSVDYDMLIPVLTAALKAQQNQIRRLQQKVESLERRLSE